MTFFFDQTLSLGAWCQATAQIRRLGMVTVPTPFDWIVTPLKPLCKIIDDGGHRLGLRCGVTEDRHFARCTEYGVLYAHEFELDAYGYPIFDGAQFEKLRSKFAHKMKRFDDACRSGKRTLFIRMGGHAEPAAAWPYLSETAPLTAEDANELVASIRRRYPLLDFHVMFVMFRETCLVEPFEAPDCSLWYLPWPSVHPASWEGETPAWKSLFEEAATKIANGALPDSARE